MHGKSFNCIIGCELSQSRSTSKSMFALRFGFILVVYCGGTVQYLLAKVVLAFLWGPTSVRKSNLDFWLWSQYSVSKSLQSKRRNLLSKLVNLVLSTIKTSILLLLACSLSGFDCLLITGWWVDAGLCVLDPAAFSCTCSGGEFWIIQSEPFIRLL